MLKERIPGDVARPIIQSYLEHYRVSGSDGLALDDPGFIAPPSPLKILAEEAGVKEDTLRKFLSGCNNSIDLYALDRILCAMGRHFLWWQEPLADYYFEVAA
jgi:hypothetical protein